LREDEVLRNVRAIFDYGQNDSALIVGNGDDGAVLSARSELTVLTSDMAVEGVHFNFAWSSAMQVGRKVSAANLADICAMGAWPEYFLVALAFPARFADQVTQLAEGIKAECNKVGVKVIGGDLSRSNEVVISISAIGRVKRPILRSGAKVGDKLWISSLPGFSAAGLSLLESSSKNQSAAAIRARLAHTAPDLDYEKYRASYDYLSSSIDTSDGLVIDASRIAAASGVGIDIQVAALINSVQFSELESASGSRDLALKNALYGGEDHLLLATSDAKDFGFLEIGQVVKGDGVYLDGVRAESSGGYQHIW
jgi:thiamine-monophosphate kinase